MCHLILSQTVPTLSPQTRIWATLILALLVVGVGAVMLGMLRWMRTSSRSLLKNGRNKPAAVTPDPWAESARRLRPDEPPAADEVQEP